MSNYWVVALQDVEDEIFVSSINMFLRPGLLAEFLFRIFRQIRGYFETASVLFMRGSEPIVLDDL
jgi:hypothetical protein